MCVMYICVRVECVCVWHERKPRMAKKTTTMVNYKELTDSVGKKWETQASSGRQANGVRC